MDDFWMGVFFAVVAIAVLAFVLISGAKLACGALIDHAAYAGKSEIATWIKSSPTCK